MLPCKEIVRMMSSAEELPLMKRAELKMHLMMCKHCSRYAKHLQMMTEGFKRLLGKKTQVDGRDVNELEHEVIDQWQKRRSR